MSSEQDDRPTNRRDFVLASAGLTAAGWAALSSQTFGAETPSKPLIQPGNTVLFQGDSITDAHRNRDQGDQPNHQPALGGGYAWMAGSQLLVSRDADELKVFNRGVSGNKVYQLADRWQEDCLDLKPDVLSILIGVNDVWHMLDGLPAPRRSRIPA
jgi:lysophospholipase L1-like esterase